LRKRPIGKGSGSSTVRVAATLEANVRSDVIGFEQCDVIDKQSGQPLPFAMRRTRIAPQLRHGIDQFHDNGALFGVEGQLRGSPLAFVGLLRFA
jgi:hypothetical protein